MLLGRVHLRPVPQVPVVLVVGGGVAVAPRLALEAHVGAAVLGAAVRKGKGEVAPLVGARGQHVDRVDDLKARTPLGLLLGEAALDGALHGQHAHQVAHVQPHLAAHRHHLQRRHGLQRLAATTTATSSGHHAQLLGQHHVLAQQQFAALHADGGELNEVPAGQPSEPLLPHGSVVHHVVGEQLVGLVLRNLVGARLNSAKHEQLARQCAPVHGGVPHLIKARPAQLLQHHLAHQAVGSEVAVKQGGVDVEAVLELALLVFHVAVGAREHVEGDGLGGVGEELAVSARSSADQLFLPVRGPAHLPRAHRALGLLRQDEVQVQHAGRVEVRARDLHNGRWGQCIGEQLEELGLVIHRYHKAAPVYQRVCGVLAGEVLGIVGVEEGGEGRHLIVKAKREEQMRTRCFSRGSLQSPKCAC